MTQGGVEDTHTPLTSESAARYGKVFDYMLEGCQIISRDFRYLYVNESVAAQGRQSKDHLLGKTMPECYPGIEKTEMYAKLSTCMETGKPQEMENEFRFPDGTIAWFELRMEPLPEGVIILSIDITRRKDIQQQEEDRTELRASFMKIISEQIKAPLEQATASIEQLRALPAKTLGAAAKKHADDCSRALTELTGHTNDMIAVFNIGESESMVEQKLFEDIWRPVHAAFVKACALKQIRLTYNEPIMTIPPFTCDPAMIRLVLERLTHNAVTYTSTGGLITVSLTHKKGIIRFEITDTGIGIPAAEQSKVFTRFFRGSNAVPVNPDGLGISLAVAQYYVSQHEGSIGFTSKVNHGSTFWFEVPAIVN